MKKLNAFTILELLLAMACTGLIIGIATTAYLLTGNSFNTYKKTNSEIMNALTVAQLLERDIQNASFVRMLNDSELVCKMPDSSEYNYIFLPEAIIRKVANGTDSFRVSVRDYSLLFDDKPCTGEGVLIDEVTLIIDVLGEQEKLRCYKQYAAKDLINN